MIKEKILALAQHLKIDYFEHDGQHYLGNEDEIIENESIEDFLRENTFLLEEEFVNTYDNYYQYGNEEYLVLTDLEADNAAYDSVMSIWEECYVPEEMKNSFLYNYIDFDKATLDAIKMDGRGHTLATYDGNENEEIIDGIYYYIYRTN